MVRKLYKHEAKALLRCMIPIDIACLLLALLSRLSRLIDFNTPAAGFIKGIFTAFYIMSIFALFIIGYVILITRFYRHLLTSEGYMTHTIPVKTSSHIHCKMICGFLFTILNVIIVICSLFIAGVGNLLFSINDLTAAWNSLAGTVGRTNMILYVVEIVLIILFAIFQMLLQPYASMAMGQKMKNKVGGAVLWYFIFYMIMQITGVILISTGIIFNMENIFSDIQATSAVHMSIITYAAYILCLDIVYYAITRFNLTSRLNLE